MNNKKNNERIYELKKKDSQTAILLSLLIAGAGQMYAGKVLKGIVILVLSALMWSVFLGWIPWIIGIFDAHYTVKGANELLRLELGITQRDRKVVA